MTDKAAGRCRAHQSRLYPHHLAHRRQDRPHLHPARQCDSRGQRRQPAAWSPSPRSSPSRSRSMLPQNGLAQIQNQYNQHRLMAVVPMAGAPGGSEKAPVDFVSNVVNASTGTIELRADFPNADMRLVPGQTVNVSAHHQPDPGRHGRAARRGQSGPRQRLSCWWWARTARSIPRPSRC